MKPNLLIPMAGRGSRFADLGFTMPKPLIVAGSKHILDWSMESIYPNEYESITFIIRQDHVNSFGLDRVLKQKYGNVNIVILDKITQGTICSCLEARKFIYNEHPLVIHTLDVSFRPRFKFATVPKDYDGYLLTFKANNPSYSYCEVKDGLVVRTAEKEVISPHANMGIYVFKQGKLFVRFADEMVEKNLTTKGELFLAPIYNLFIQAGMKIGHGEVVKAHLMGTPDELHFFVRNTLPKFGDKPIALCSDHSGFQCKAILKSVLQDKGIEFIDFGCYTSEKQCDYTTFVKAAAQHITDGICDFACASCRTGEGVSIAANKIKGIRSALIYDDFVAEMARRHNYANFFTFPERNVTKEMLSNYIQILVENTPDGGRHQNRVMTAEK